MTIDITFLESAPIQHRFKDGKIWDVIDYPFRISDGKSTSIVNVGITGQFHDPAEALGSKGLTQGELVEAARTWLRSRFDKGNCDPIAHPETDRYIDVPPAVMDYGQSTAQFPSCSARGRDAQVPAKSD